jgi:hypothetical protein
MLVAQGEAAEGNMLSNQLYFAKRASQEASRAARAFSPSAKLWHQELAQKFAQQATDASGHTASLE